MSWWIYYIHLYYTRMYLLCTNGVRLKDCPSEGGNTEGRWYLSVYSFLTREKKTRNDFGFLYYYLFIRLYIYIIVQKWEKLNIISTKNTLWQQDAINTFV